MTFRLAALSEGNSPLYWDDIQTILGEADVPIIPDAAYQPYTEVITLMDKSAEWDCPLLLGFYR